MSEGPARSSDRLILFARYPSPGKTKTRLIPALGPTGAAELHTILTQRTLRTITSLQLELPIDFEIRFSNGTQEEMSHLFPSPGARFVLQCEGSLGDRLADAVDAAFKTNARRVVVIGTDSPDLSATVLAQAFRELEKNQVVIGPAFDGGYTLIGLSQPCKEVFCEISWGTEHVLEQTLRRCRNFGFSFSLLDSLSDVDHPEDLLVCRRLSPEFDNVLPKTVPGVISIVIPAFNEASTIRRTLGQFNKQSSLEVVVVDGESTDDTAAIAAEWGAKVVSTKRGRGRQMNAGAALAAGEFLIFLHADTELPSDFQSRVRTALGTKYTAGAFRLQIDHPSWLYRGIEWGANFRSICWQRPYGDQAVFIRSTDFLRIGGFQNWPIMEDFEFAERIKRKGRIALLDVAAKTSARRWQKQGLLRTTLRNQFLIWAYRLGVSPKTLASLVSAEQRVVR